MELGPAEQPIDFVESPDQRQALLLRQELKVASPGRALAQALLVHESHRQPQATVQAGRFDQRARAARPDGEASCLRDGGDEVAFLEVAQRPNGDSRGGIVGEAESVAAIDGVRLHPPLERPQPPAREGMEIPLVCACVRACARRERDRERVPGSHGIGSGELCGRKLLGEAGGRFALP